MVTIEELVDEVKQYAVEHYTEGGWDVIVECWSDGEIAEVLRGEHVKGWRPSRSAQGAIARFKPMVAVWADRQADAINSAF